MTVKHLFTEDGGRRRAGPREAQVTLAETPSRPAREPVGRTWDNGPVSPVETDRDPARVAASRALFERARAVTPGGVNSPVRAFNAVGGTPRFITRAQGPYLYDADGTEYVDLICSWGPMLLGHAHPAVLAAIGEQAAKGTHYFAYLNEPALELADKVANQVPCVEKLRFTVSGSEATRMESARSAPPVMVHSVP